MTKRYTLAVAAIVCFSVTATILNEQGVRQDHTFSVTCTRLDEEEWKQRFEGRAITDVVKEVVTGWSGQDLVLDEGTPAAFSPDALDALLRIPGMARHLFDTYMENIGVVKN